VAEVKNANISKTTLELLSQATRLNANVEAVLIGGDVAGLADVLAGHGAATVYVAADSSLAPYSTSPYTAALREAVEKSNPDQMWLSASELGRDLTPRIAARLGVGAITDVTAIDGDSLKRPAMASKVIQECAFTHDGLKIISVRAGAFEVSLGQACPANIVALATPEADLRAVVKEVLSESGEWIDLSDAQVVVSVGRGVKGPEGVELVRPLAAALGAGFGASPAVCDAGWMPHNTQIGQTG
ncbi:uncharacterized protein METZ01_LOCUS351945, partial [marine metagenome]